MDKLPVYLVKSIENACNIFDNITFTIHGDENKARISIMFGQTDSKQSTRKSKSMERRNNKRMQNYIEKVTKKDDKLEGNKSFVQGTIESNDDQLMEIETETVRSAETDTTVVENCTFALQDSNTNFSNTYSDKVEVEKMNKGTGNAQLSVISENKVIETIRKEEKDTTMTIQSDESDDDSDDDSDVDSELSDYDGCPIQVPIDDIIVKAVIKTSRLLPDKFIAKIKGTEKLVKYDRGRNKVGQVRPKDVDYDTYKQNVEQDFPDVRNYEFRPDDTDDILFRIADCAIANGLYKHRK